MAQIIREITLDVAQANNLRAITAKQNDLNSRFLKIHITDEGAPILVNPDYTVIMNVKRTDNTARMFYGSVNDDGSVTVPLTPWMLDIEGSINCDVSIVSVEDTQKLTTLQFSIYVEAAVLPKNVLEDTEDYDVLIDLLDAAERIDECVAATVEAQEAAAEARQVSRGVVIKEQNTNSPLTFWVGSQAEYDAIENKDMGCFYIISDDAALDELYTLIANYHTPYDVSEAVVPNHDQDTCTLTKYGNTVELNYTLCAWRTTSSTSSLDTNIATIEGYAPRCSFCVPATPLTALGNSIATADYETAFVLIKPEGKNTSITLLGSRAYGAAEIGTPILSFNHTFVLK